MFSFFKRKAKHHNDEWQYGLSGFRTVPICEECGAMCLRFFLWYTPSFAGGGISRIEDMPMGVCQQCGSMRIHKLVGKVSYRYRIPKKLFGASEREYDFDSFKFIPRAKCLSNTGVSHE